MSQVFDPAKPIEGTTAWETGAVYQVIRDKFAAIASWFSGTSLFSDPIVGQFSLKTNEGDSGRLYVADNTATLNTDISELSENYQNPEWYDLGSSYGGSDINQSLYLAGLVRQNLHISDLSANASVQYFSNAVSGQTLTIYVTEATYTLTIKHAAGKILLSGAANYVMNQDSTLTLVEKGGIWYEIGRQDLS